MSDPLSIGDAAREAGGSVGLRIAGHAFTFAELARRAHTRMREIERELRPGRPYVLVGHNTPDTLVSIYALLELRAPMLMLHPRLKDPERHALLAGAEQRGGIGQDDAAAVLFTSGTTGVPRGAVLSRTAFVASATASEDNLGWRDDDCWFACMTMGHVGGLSIVTRCLMARRTVALSERFDARRFVVQVADERATLVSVVPTMLASVLQANPDWRPPSHLRGVLIGGAAAPRALLERAAARGVPVLPTYGLTETCSQLTTVPYANGQAVIDAGSGPALTGAQLRVVDGQIEVRGPMLMSGYWGEPPLSADEWFVTGDLGEIDARGNLHVFSRRSDLIVTGGENVYPMEVEQALEALPGVTAAGVFGVPDQHWGQTVAAALVVERPVPDATLFAHVDACLAPHKRPRRVCFVATLPQTPGGKLDRRALAAFTGALRPLPSQ